MKTIKSLMLMMLMVFVGGVICSCGDDKDDDNGGITGTYTLHCTISDPGTLPEQQAAIMKQALERNVNKEMPNITLELAKKALDIAIDDAIAYGTYDDQEYNFTIEFYITDANGNKVYSRSIVVKDGKATKK